MSLDSSLRLLVGVIRSAPYVGVCILQSAARGSTAPCFGLTQSLLATVALAIDCLFIRTFVTTSRCLCTRYPSYV
ncbi:uncharacterized protein GGS22DRAFT_150258 [Annulohypoxylon maeteangense]|uniref:uncharacterized protein n=1 Tax=Annulohypoxylon maeteangense TaxID=1927788 RepID=UPI002007626E|nr:uncharacterized protein GGS22DRAFT_150258 [Annulohypoxylon maeteangense]KAI0890218.1 hypothetical protein GGS22DRAFT_150258 [Annulohypoxylon maeteangense]